MPAELFDLEKAVKDWAWKVYWQTASKKQKKLREKELKKGTPYIGLQIDWSGVKFKDETSWPPLTEEEFDESEAGAADVVDAKQTTDASLKPTSSKAHSSVLFQTKFHNNTDDFQEYTLRTERTTCSTCETSLEHGFTRGYEMSVTLKSPGEILEASAGYHNEETLTNSAGQTFEEEMTWGVESLIRVKGKHVAEASLVVQEKKFSGDYVIKTQVWGHVFVSFTNLRENNAQFKATGHDISEIIKSYLASEGRKGKTYDYVDIDEAQSMVTIATKGKCRFRFGIKQEVKVYQTPLGST